MAVLRVRRSRGVQGDLRAPSDKSISHRAAIIGAIAEGETHIADFLPAGDTLGTARALQAMGVRMEGLGTAEVVVRGVGLRGLRAPEGPLDLGNSGTGMRLLMGVLAGQPFAATLVGDASLSRRPMDRIAHPLGLMGIRVDGQGERCTPPVTVHGGAPRAVGYRSPIASAQVKSAVLLAGLFCEGVVSVTEPAQSRDHTERMLAAFGARVTADGPTVSVEGGPVLCGRPVHVPADFSSSAYFLAAALLCPESCVTTRRVILNPTRTGLLEALRRMGANMTASGEREVAGERVGDIPARTSALAAVRVGGEEIPRLIDEIPLLAVLATQAEGTTEVREAAELRVKESDRIAVVAEGLRAMGAAVNELDDGMVIEGPARLRGATIDARHDHRIAMSFAVAGLVAEGETVITGAECIATSFPGYAPALAALGAEVEDEG